VKDNGLIEWAYIFVLRRTLGLRPKLRKILKGRQAFVFILVRISIA